MQRQGLGHNLCVTKKPCNIFEQLTPTQKEMLSAATHKDKKAALLVDPKVVIVVGPVESVADDGVTLEFSVHAHTGQLPGASKFVSVKQLLDDKWNEPFARFESLFSRW